MIKNIGFGITGSFCTHEKILEEIKNLKTLGYNIIPIITPAVKETNTRFGKASEFIENLKQITNQDVIDNIVTAEPIGPKNLIDALIIAPCTGNTLAKLASAITDNAVTMVAKSLQRNNKPIIIGISTNDAIGLNFLNIAKLLNTKNFYFVPFYQDNYKNKPKSLIADWTLINNTIIEADNRNQIQPLITFKEIN